MVTLSANLYLLLGFHTQKILDAQAYRPVLASPETMMEFHSPDYINFLQNVSPENQVRRALTEGTTKGTSTVRLVGQRCQRCYLPSRAVAAVAERTVGRLSLNSSKFPCPRLQVALEDECRKFMVGSDCPAFEGLFPYCQVGCNRQELSTMLPNMKFFFALPQSDQC